MIELALSRAWRRTDTVHLPELGVLEETVTAVIKLMIILRL